MFEGKREAQRMKTKSENLLPKIIPGSVHRQYIRCGKSSCKCARGELHGAYFYYFTRINGKLTKRYLKASEVESFQAACRAHREQAKARRLQSLEIIRCLRESGARLRELSKEIDSLIGE